MERSLVEAMEDYLDAGLAMDIDKLDGIYDPAFENVRLDASGQSVTLTKAQFMGRFRAMRDQGQKLDSTEDMEFVATSVYGDHASILARRVKGGEPVLYNFVWRLRDGRPATIIREFTHEKDITYLVKMLEAFRAGQASEAASR